MDSAVPSLSVEAKHLKHVRLVTAGIRRTFPVTLIPDGKGKPPSVCQVTVGAGLPDAIHRSVADSPKNTLGGTTTAAWGGKSKKTTSLCLRFG